MSEALPQFEEVKIPLPDRLHDLDSVPGVLGVPEWWPTGSRVAVVLARASGDEDPLIDSLQRELAAKKVLTLSFAMPYMVARKKNPDDMRFLKRTYQAAVALLGQDPSAAPAHIFIGGKNAGALVAAQAGCAGPDAHLRAADMQPRTRIVSIRTLHRSLESCL